MNRASQASRLREVLGEEAASFGPGNLLELAAGSALPNQAQTNAAFSEKWTSFARSAEKERLFEAARAWYLELYGFGTETSLAAFLRGRRVIFDAGCGLGYKAAWFARLAPDSLVLAMDISSAVDLAATEYRDLENLFFIRGDIAETGFRDGSVDFVSCDQVIMHTESPERTFRELTRVTAPEGEVACYFYAKKALPRELIDEHFRTRCKELSNEQLWELSEQVTELGKRLSELRVSFDCPGIPALGIKAGRYDIQRFLYWNFLKCFWNEDLGRETSVHTNFDWYSPSNARRFSKEEVLGIVRSNGLECATFHEEEACYSGRFRRATGGARPDAASQGSP